MISKMSTFQFFPNLGLEGGGHQISIFSQIQISPHYPGGGVKKVMDFFHNFVTFLVLNDSLCFPRLRAGAFESESSGTIISEVSGMEWNIRPGL